MGKLSFDYEDIAKCEYGINDPYSPGGVSSCGEPAIRYIWWDDYENGMKVCQRHFLIIETMEVACQQDGDRVKASEEGAK